MLYYQLFFLAVLFIFSIGWIIGLLIVIHKKPKYKYNDDVNRKILKEAIKNKIRSIISDPNRFDDFRLFTIFKDQCIQLLFDEIIENVKKQGSEYLNCSKSIDIEIDSFSVILMDELNDQTTIDFFHRCYINWIENNIKEAQRLEDEAVRYHNTFGTEPEGDPILHPKEKNNDGIVTDEKDTNVEDLLDTGTIEDLE